jgi:hypothetical protein
MLFCSIYVPFLGKVGKPNATERQSLASMCRFYALYIGRPRPAVGLAFFFWVNVVFFIDGTCGRARAVLLTITNRD